MKKLDSFKKAVNLLYIESQERYKEKSKKVEDAKKVAKKQHYSIAVLDATMY